MKVLFQLLVILPFLSVTTAFPAWAQEDGSLKLTSSILRQVEVENEKGEKVVELVPVEKAMPGEELIIRISYTNEGSEPAVNLVISNPVPDQMSYVSGSASGDFVQATFSIDGGKTFDLPDKLLVLDEEGRKKQAPPSMYTHVLFTRTSALAPGMTDEVSFRAVLK